MTHTQLEFWSWVSLYIWLPICFLVFIYLIYRANKKLANHPQLKENNVNAVNSITLLALRYSLPALIISVVMTIPIFYVNHLVKQEDYCLTVVRVNKIEYPERSDMLQERCSDFDLPELIKRAYSE